MANSDFAIGRLALAELPDAQALVAEAGWNQVAADWRMFLDFGTAYAVRAQGRVVATAAWIPYGACAWISMVLVTAGERRRGLATRLLHRCIADVTAAGLVPVLDATPAGAKVYAPLGFIEAWGFARFVSERRVVQPAETPLRSSQLPMMRGPRCAPMTRRCLATTGAKFSRACAAACRRPIFSRGVAGASPECCLAAKGGPRRILVR